VRRRFDSFQAFSVNSAACIVDTTVRVCILHAQFAPAIDPLGHKRLVTYEASSTLA